MNDIEHFNHQLNAYITRKKNTRRAYDNYLASRGSTRQFRESLKQEMAKLEEKYATIDIKRLCERKHWYRIECIHREVTK